MKNYLRDMMFKIKNRFSPASGETEAEDKKQSGTKYKKILIWSGGLLSILAILILGLLIYLHQGRFEVAFNQVPLTTYLQQDIGRIMSIEGREITINISEDALNTIFSERINGLALTDKEQVVDGYINTAEKKAYINMLVRGFYVPMSMETVFQTTDRMITLTFTQVQLKDQKLLSLPKSSEKKWQDKWESKVSKLQISLDDYAIPKIANIRGVELHEDGMRIILNMREDILAEEMKRIRTDKSQELYQLYQSKEGIEGRASQIIGNDQPLTSEETEEILLDIFFQNQQLMKHMMVITHEDNMDYIRDTYGHYLKKIHRQDIMNSKYKLILGKIETYCGSLLEALKALPKEDYIVFGNDPYDYKNKKRLTIADIIEYGKLTIPENVSSKMGVLYNYEKAGYTIAYKVDENTYGIIGEDYYDFVDKNTYEGYHFQEPGENQERVDLEVKQKIEELFGTKVFVRYMNTDGAYAFAIVSPDNNYQSYERMALVKKEDEWQVVDTGIIDLYAFSIKHPGFNIKTVTDRDMNDKIYSLSSKDISVVMDQLVYQKIIEDKKSASIVYCSFDGEYIALKLDNGEEYVFNIRYAYLDKVYKKEVAIAKWKDISPLILLQDYEEEVVEEPDDATEVETEETGQEDPKE